MKRLGILSCVLLLLTVMACTKEDPIPNQHYVGSLEEITVPSNFNWSTARTVDVYITGLPTDKPVLSTLTLSLNDGSNLYQGMYNMSDSKVIRVFIPSLDNQIKLTYGTMNYDVPVTGSRADFSFLPKILE